MKNFSYKQLKEILISLYKYHNDGDSLTKEEQKKVKKDVFLWNIYRNKVHDEIVENLKDFSINSLRAELEDFHKYVWIKLTADNYSNPDYLGLCDAEEIDDYIVDDKIPAVYLKTEFLTFENEFCVLAIEKYFNYTLYKKHHWGRETFLDHLLNDVEDVLKDQIERKDDEWIKEIAEDGLINLVMKYYDNEIYQEYKLWEEKLYEIYEFFYSGEDKNTTLYVNKLLEEVKLKVLPKDKKTLTIKDLEKIVKYLKENDWVKEYVLSDI